MRLKNMPFLISLFLLVCLIGLLPWMLTRQESSSTLGAAVGLLPLFGLGVVLATCSSEEQSGKRGLLLVPASALLGALMAGLSWIYASTVGPQPQLLMLGYACVNVAGALSMFGLMRLIYLTKLSLRRARPVAVACATPALLLLVLPLTPTLHGFMTAIWVAFLGLGIAWLSRRRKRGARA
jgi:hypothetical protein